VGLLSFFSLYSGNLREARLRVDPADLHRLPSSARAAAQPDGTLDLLQWSFTELDVAPYPEDRVALNIGRSLARNVSQGPVWVELAGKPHPLTKERAIRFFRCPIGGGPCLELGEVEYNQLKR
jgi:hypothetical protein